MDRFIVKKKRSNELAKPAKSAKRSSEDIGWARCPICDATVAISVMGQHVDSGCKEFAGAKRRKSEAAAAPALFAVPHETLGGQYIVADFLSEEEEAEILAFLDASSLEALSVSYMLYHDCFSFSTFRLSSTSASYFCSAARARASTGSPRLSRSMMRGSSRSSEERADFTPW